VIAVDTNVLLRYLLWDDERQALKADRLMNGPAAVLITDVVLAETLWTLKGKKYRRGLANQLFVLQSLHHEQGEVHAARDIAREDGVAIQRILHHVPPELPGRPDDADLHPAPPGQLMHLNSTLLPSGSRMQSEGPDPKTPYRVTTSSASTACNSRT
jgi:predicted nucleic acid-binding protein